MAYRISDKCEACGKCEPVCPVEAIKKNDKKYVINEDDCVSCGRCADECPVEAIAEV
jgi:ferredoxin